MILGIVENEVNVRKQVTLLDCKKVKSKWQRSMANNDGWFSFLNPESNEFLTATAAEHLIIAGKL